VSQIISVEGLYKVFGPNPEKGMSLLSRGMSKDEIFSRSGNTVGVQDAGFAVREGEVFVIMGLSGSGKSTMVRMLNRLIEPTAGRIEINGREVTSMGKADLIRLRRGDMAMVFQSFALMPHKTVIENAAFGLEITGMESSRRKKRAFQALEQVGLDANADSYPDELSGGMQQRVGLARALATDPSIMLMDEAFSALDPLIRTEMQDELVALQQQQQRTVIFISHDLDEAIRIGDRIAIMEEGKVVQIGTPEQIVREPANDYVRSFFHGVDITRVFTAGHILEKDRLPVVHPGESELRSVLDDMQRNQDRFAAVVGDDGTFDGLVSVGFLSRQITGDGTGPIEAAREPIEPVSRTTPLADLLGLSAEHDCPVPVVDEEGRYLGAVTPARLLKTLDRTGDRSHG